MNPLNIRLTTLPLLAVTIATAITTMPPMLAPAAARHRAARHSRRHHSTRHNARRARHSARIITGRASYHEHTSRHVTAAHGVRRGAKLWVWVPGKSPRSGIAVWVNDAGPYWNDKHGTRVLDLSTGAFSTLYGGLGRGHGPVCYKVLSEGRGAWTGALRGGR